ncbi:hypothetical protein BH11ARM1_BH11ARM1_10460 [soil metagenome]
MEMAIFSQALRDYLRPSRVLPWIALSGLCGLLALVWHFIQPQSTTSEQYAWVSSILVFRRLALAAAIYTTSIISQEVEQRTIVYLVTRPVPRWKLLLIRYLASVIVVSLIGTVGVLVTSFGAFHTLGGNALIANDLKAIVLGAFAYGALFLFISLIINRSMIVCLLFAFGWETSVPNMPGSMGNLSILTHLQAVSQHPAVQGEQNGLALIAGSLGTNSISADQAWGVMIALTAVMLIASAYWFTNFEYVPREDAD